MTEKKEWRCYHCDEVFTSDRCARLHFGRTEASEPACRIPLGVERSLLGEVRRLEDEVARLTDDLHQENGDGVKAYRSALARHRTQLTLAEEKGFSRGMEADLSQFQLQEANLYFGNYTAPAPSVPQLGLWGTAVLEKYAKRLAEMAQALKREAAWAKVQGDEDAALLLVRVQLSVEETGEWAEALVAGDLKRAFSELLDIDYVTQGHYLTLGVGALKAEGFRRLHQANMSKLVECETCDGSGTTSPDDTRPAATCTNCEGRRLVPKISDAGRWMKGPNYRPPVYDGLLEPKGE